MCLLGANSPTSTVWDAQPLLSVWRSRGQELVDARGGGGARVQNPPSAGRSGRCPGAARGSTSRRRRRSGRRRLSPSPPRVCRRCTCGGWVKSKETRPRSKRTGWARHSLPTDPEGGLAVQDGDDSGQVHLHLVLGQHWREKAGSAPPPRPDAGSALPRGQTMVQQPPRADCDPPYSRSSKPCWSFSPLSVLALML